jgi:cyclopropane fatty-acyl-phospholipid synthase-like methyltransferase
MSIGSLARAILGTRLFPIFGSWYRAVFVDLEKVVDSLPPLKPGSRVLDIGGGDGEMINILLARHPDLDITMIDRNPRLGLFLTPESRKRVRLMPSTSLQDYAATQHEAPDLVMVSDVIHHVPVESRSAFFADLRLVVAGRPTTLVVKDVERGSFRSHLSLWADWYISGDRQVSLIGRDELTGLVKAAFPTAQVQSTKLYDVDRPNYSLVFVINAGS